MLIVRVDITIGSDSFSVFRGVLRSVSTRSLDRSAALVKYQTSASSGWSLCYLYGAVRRRSYCGSTVAHIYGYDPTTLARQIFVFVAEVLYLGYMLPRPLCNSNRVIADCILLFEIDKGHMRELVMILLIAWVGH